MGEPSIERRWSGGKWQTVEREEGPSGGSQARERIVGDHVEVGNNTAYTNLTWDTKQDGDDLLDLTDPSAPTAIVAGVYAVSVAIQVFDSMTVGGNYSAVLDLDRDGDVSTEMIVTSAPASALNASPSLSINATYFVPAGGVISVAILNQDGVSAINFFLDQAAIVRL